MFRKGNEIIITAFTALSYLFADCYLLLAKTCALAVLITNPRLILRNDCGHEKFDLHILTGV